MILGLYIRNLHLSNINNERILRYQRDTDVLTGLGARHILFEHLDRIKEEKDTLIDVIMIDIDFFKLYNDTYGHQAGDACLAALGGCFFKFGQKHNFLFCRYGGEEFTAVGRGISKESLAILAEELRSEVESMRIPSEHGIGGIVTISVGYAVCPSSSNNTAQSYIQPADMALYQVKKSGRNACYGETFNLGEI